MLTTKDPGTTEVVAPIMHAAMQKFLSRNRDRIAVVRGGAKEVQVRIASELALDDDADIAVETAYNELTSEDSDVAGSALTHSNRMVRSVARGFLERAFYRQLCQAWLRLFARGALVDAVALTDEAAEQQTEIEYDSGCRRRPQEVQVQEQAGESLDDEITADWNGRLTTAQVRSKKASNPQYGARLDQLLNEGKLQ